MPADHPIETINAAGAPDFVQGDAAALLARAKSYFEEATGRTLSPSQVEMYLLETAAYLVSIVAAEEQLGLEGATVAFAKGDDLDRLGADRNTPRLDASAATTTLRFSTAAPALAAITISPGTRVSDTAGQVHFLTLDTAVIGIGAQSVDVAAKAAQTGAQANGFPAGTIDKLIDPVPGIAAIENLTETGNGAARETDARYRTRLAMAFERLGLGLSRERYVADVLAWNARCIDVAVIRPEPGHVHIHPLMDTGAPNAAELADLKAIFDDSNTHQGDYIQVLPPVAHSFDLELDLVVMTPEAADEAEAAVQAVLDAWAGTLGGYLAPSELIRAARGVDGVVEADVSNLVFTPVADNAWRDCTALAVAVEVL